MKTRQLPSYVAIVVVLIMFMMGFGLILSSSPLGYQIIAAYPVNQNTQSAYPSSEETTPSETTQTNSENSDSTLPSAYPAPNEITSPTNGSLTANLTNLDKSIFLPVVYQRPAYDIANVSKKKGLALTFSRQDPHSYEPFQISWYHNWDSLDYVNSYFLEHIPFIWCDYGFPQRDSANEHPPIDLIDRAVDNLGQDYSGYLLILNEPNLDSLTNPQCDVTVQRAAEIYVEIRTAFPNAKIIGPHVSQDGRIYSAVEYVEAWRNAVLALTEGYPDVVGYGLHSYTGTAETALINISDFREAMIDWGEADKELWMTEIGFCNDPTIDTEITILLNAFETEALEYVTRYAYYTTRQVRISNTTPPSWLVCRSTELYKVNSELLSKKGEAFRNLGLVNDE